ncbi:MAG: hypothetical protein ACFE0O_04415 [Opitutales bacterium]
MKPINLSFQWSLVLGLLVVLSGCATHDPEPVAELAPRKVVFGDAPDSQWERSVRPDPNDPQSIVRYCLALSRMGRHQAAGQFLEEAANRYESRDNAFALAALSAAANEYLRAGNGPAFKRATLALHDRADRYQIAVMNTEMAALLTLGDVAQGKSQPEDYAPQQLRELFLSQP